MGLNSLWMLSVVTLNVWGVPNAIFKELTPAREKRIAAICKELKYKQKTSEEWDIVLLQEVWLPEDREVLRHCGYSYSADLDDPDSDLDSGLMILSRYPITEVHRLTFSENGYMKNLFSDGEFLARKSALLAKVQHPRFGNLWTMNTHLVSQYSQEDEYFNQREKQLLQLLEWVQKKVSSDPVVLGGDFNFGTESDLWNKFFGTKSGLSKADYNSGLCTYRKALSVSYGCKVDHVFGSIHFEALSGGLAFRSLLASDDGEIPLSDHYGWETHFVFSEEKVKKTKSIQVDVTRLVERISKII